MKLKINRFIITILLCIFSFSRAKAQEYSKQDIIRVIIEAAYRTEGLISDSEHLIKHMRDTLMAGWNERPEEIETLFDVIYQVPNEERVKLVDDIIPLQSKLLNQRKANAPQSISTIIAESELGYLSYLAGKDNGLDYCYDAYKAAMQENKYMELSMYYSIDEKRYAMNPFVLLGDAMMQEGQYEYAETFYKQAFPIDVYSLHHLAHTSPETIFDEIWNSSGHEIYRQLYSYPIHMLKLAKAAKANGNEAWEDYLIEAFYSAAERLYRSFRSLDEDRQLWLTNLYCPIFEMQYGNTNTKWAYDAALFIKGCSNNVSSDIREMYTGDVNLDDWGYYRSQYNRTEESERQEREKIRSFYPPSRYEEYIEAKGLYSRNPSVLNRNKLDSLVNRIHLDMIFYKASLKNLKYTYADIQKALGEGQVAIEFVRVSDDKADEVHYDALVLRSSLHEPIRVKLCSEKELNEAISTNHYNLYKQENHILYDLIWKPLENHIQEGESILYSPDGLLHLVNIDMMANIYGKRVCESYKSRRTSSTREICNTRPSMEIDATLYGGLQYKLEPLEMVALNRKYVGYKRASRGFGKRIRSGITELKYSLNEVNEVMDIVGNSGGRSILLSGADGTEESFKSISGKSTPILHLATHGFFLNEEVARGEDYYTRLCLANPNLTSDAMMRSGLLMSGAQAAWTGEELPDNVEDGVLLAQEIAGLDLSNTSLLILSACNTALGDISQEGIIGLQQGFKKAGVGTMILTLWEVNDRATKDFVTRYYKNMIQEKNILSAFTKTQLEMSRDAKYKSPYYWASFVLIY